MDFVVCFGCGGMFSVLCFSSNAHSLLQVRGHLASFTSLLIYMYVSDYWSVQHADFFPHKDERQWVGGQSTAQHSLVIAL